MSAGTVERLVGEGWTVLQHYNDGVTLLEKQEGDCEEAWPRVFVGWEGSPGPVRTLRCMMEETRLRGLGIEAVWSRRPREGASA